MATTNPWKQFSGLLPKSSRIIGTVSQHNGNGTSTVTLRNGSTLIVQGQSVAVSHKALIEEGTLVRQVPDLPVYAVSI